MRSLCVPCLLTLAACIPGAAPSRASPPWEPLYGSYWFSGTIIEAQGHRTTVEGTLVLEEGHYYLNSNQGNCSGDLSPTSRMDLGWQCRNGFSLAFRRIGDRLASEGTGSIKVEEIVYHEVCTTDQNGNRVCRTESTVNVVTRSGRMVIEKVSIP